MDIHLIRDISIILGFAVLVIYLFQKWKLPTILGFLVTGGIIGPFGINLIQGSEEINLVAEIGVILLLFIIGMEFSLSKLIAIRQAVFIGGALQVFLTVGIVALLVMQLGFDYQKAVFLGCLISMSSTAIVLKLLQDSMQMNSPQGIVALGILIFQDIIVVPMMLFAPMLAGEEGSGLVEVLLLLGKIILIMVLVFVLAKYVMPALLYQVVRTRNKELFLLTIIVICFLVAFATHEIGLSLSLGAFMAGLIISESEYSHQAAYNIIPLREIFTSFFFVSIGMLLDLSFLIENLPLILLFSVLVFILKGLIAGFAAWVLKFPLRIVILVGFTLFQVGEFAFILSKVGLEYNLLSLETYQYFLSVSIITMAVTPFVIKGGQQIASRITQTAIVNKWMPDAKDHEDIPESDHVVIIGYGLNGRNVARAAEYASIPYIILDLNPDTVRRERKKGKPIMYGDALLTGILENVNVPKAKVVVIAISDPDSTKKILVNIRQIGQKPHIIVRTRFEKEMEENYKLGANEVIPEEFETSIEIFTRVLNKYLVPLDEIHKLTYQIRKDNYEMLRLPEVQKDFQELKLHLPMVDISSVKVQRLPEDLKEKSIREAQLRNNYGINILAIKRGDDFFADVPPEISLQEGDIIYVMGHQDKVYAFSNLISNEHK